MAWVGICSKILKPMWQGTKIVANKWSHLCFSDGHDLAKKALIDGWKTNNGLNNLPSTLKGAWNAVPEKGGVDVFKNIGNSLFNRKMWSSDIKAMGKLKAIGKRLPVIGSLIILPFEIPNIYRAYTDKDGGLFTGTLEIAKAAARLGVGMTGSAIGAAIGSFAGPVGGVIGGLIGWTVGEWIGNKFGLKSFTEKQEEKQQQLAQAQQQMQAQQMPSLGALAQQYAQAQQQIAQNAMMSNPMYNNCFTQNPFASNQQQFKSLAQMYQEYSMMQQMLAQQAMMQQCGNWGCVA